MALTAPPPPGGASGRPPAGRASTFPRGLARGFPRRAAAAVPARKALARWPAGWQLAGTAAKAEHMRPRPGPRRAPARLVDAVWARRVAAELDRAGLPAAQLLREVGLRRERLAGPDARVPFAAHVALLEAAARALAEPCFGVRLGSAVELAETGLVGYLALSSRALREALRNPCRYLAPQTEGASAELREEAGEARPLFGGPEPARAGTPQPA